jgi:Tol biopolymer transport system component
MKKIFYLFFAGVLLTGCAAVANIDYASISVPEEGGTNFTKYNEESEKIVGPYVGRNPLTGTLQWYAAPFISLSKDGAKMAYVGLNNNFFNIYIKGIKGGKSIVQKTFNKNVYDMCFSPSGDKIVFSAKNGSDLSIYMINTDGGSAIQQLVATSANELGATFSPDGKRVYYAKEENGRYYIWSIDLESSLQTQYTEGFTPKPLHDGKSILITRNSKDGKDRGEIWLIDLEKGTESCILSDPKIGFSSPDISPDGKTIVCVGSTQKNSTKPENLDLYTFNLDGSNLRQQTFHGGNDVSPQWSSDGQSIFFISQRGNNKGNYNLWRLNYKN